MNISREELIKAYSKWIRAYRINPTKFAKTEEIAKHDVKTEAIASTNALLNYLGVKKRK